MLGSRIFRVWMCAQGLLAVASPRLPAQAPTDSGGVERLAALGKLWGVVKFFQPAFLERAVNWDSAVVAAIPRVRAAGSTAAYAAAVGDLLATLGDPATRVVNSAAGETATTPPGSFSARWEADSTLVVSAPGFTGDSAAEQLRALVAQVRAARQIVFDLRGPAPAPDEYSNASYLFQATGLAALLPPGPVAAPGIRSRMYSGFPPQWGASSGGYWAGTYETQGDVFTPPPGNPQRRVAFVTYATSDIPSIAWALQEAEQGTIVLDRARGIVLASSDVYTVPMGEGVEAQVTVGELADPSGRSLAPDTAVTSTATADTPLALALAAVRTVPQPRPVERAPTTFVPPPEQSYPDMHYPALGYRVLAAYR